jgi:uncharacterized membrane protein YdjX (TVP38/TMEM64 family)
MSFLHAALAPKTRAPRALPLTMPNKGRHAAVPSPGPSLAGSARLRRFLPFAAVILALAVILAMGWHRQLSFETLVRHRAGIDAFVAEHYAAAVAVFVALYVAVAALSVPGAAVLTICGGILFGWLVGGLAAIAGATAGATIIFSIARTACGESLLRCAGSRAQSIAEGFRSDAFSYLLFLRLVPIFPFWLVNLAPALVGVRLVTFVGATALGIVPGTFAYALVGEGLDSVIRAEGAAFRACLAAGSSDCQLHFDMAAALTPQLLAALVALGLIALIPVLLRRRRARNAANP